MLAVIPITRAADADKTADIAPLLCSGAAHYMHGTVVSSDGVQTNLDSLAFGNALLESLKPSPTEYERQYGFRTRLRVRSLSRIRFNYARFVVIAALHRSASKDCCRSSSGRSLLN